MNNSENLPKITIVTASYNQGDYIEQTIKSILNQDYPNLEYIIMDGGSDDGSVDIIKKYDSQITHWQSGPDDGQADAIAKGFAMATGDVLGWINSDDFLLPGALQAIGKAFSENPETIWVSGKCAIVDTEGNPYAVFVPAKQSMKNMLFWGARFSQQSTFWKKQAYEKAGGLKTDMQFAFDYDLFANLHEQGRLKIIKNYIAGFRFHPDSKTCSWGIDIKFKENKQVILRHKKVGKLFLFFRKKFFIHSPHLLKKLISRLTWIRDRREIRNQCRQFLIK